MSRTLGTTRARILASALDLLLEHGFHGFGLEAVAAAAGFSRQTVYRHFESRTGLLEALVDHVPEVEGKPDVDGVPAAEALERIVRFNVAYLARIRRFAALIHSARAEVPEAAAAWQRRMGVLRRRWLSVIERLAAEGALAEGWSVADVADLCWAVVSFPVYEYLVVDGGWEAERYERELARLLKRAFVAPAP